MDFFLAVSTHYPAILLPLEIEPSVPPGSPMSFTSNNTFGTRQKCVKGNARALMSRGCGGGALSKSSCYLHFKGCFAAISHAHIAVTFYPDSSLALHLYLCVPTGRFHARFFLLSVSSGCTLTQRAPPSPEDMHFLVWILITTQ